MDDEALENAIDHAISDAVMGQMQACLHRVGFDTGLLGGLGAEARAYWEARAPVIMTFGARVIRELLALTPDIRCSGRVLCAGALFQLAAGFLDWVGDDLGEGESVPRWLPPGLVSELVASPTARRMLVARACDGASWPVAAFIGLLCASIEMSNEFIERPRRYARLLGDAYATELATFAPAAAVPRRAGVARARAVTPSLVLGELARAATRTTLQNVVWQAAVIIAPVIGIVDDIADLDADARTGHPNTLLRSRIRNDDESVAALRHALDAGRIAREAEKVRRAAVALNALFLNAGIEEHRQQEIYRWLRTLFWRWLA